MKTNDINCQHIYMLIACAALITFALFFVDEGFFNFQWMRNGGNWIVFGIYFLILFSGQLITYVIISKILHWQKRMFLSITLGSILGIVVAFGLVF